MRSVRRAVRQFTRTSGFTAAAVLSVALGIGATTAMFTLTNALLLKPLSVRDAERLIHIAAVDAQGNDPGLPLAFVDLLRTEAALEGVCGFLTPLSTVEMHGSVSARSTHVFSGDCFATLGVRSASGRILGPADDRPGAPPVAVLTYDTWVRDFGGRPDAVGQQMTIEGRQTTIMGVSEPGFRGLLLGFPAHVVYPLSALQEQMRARAPSWLMTLPVYVFARVRGGESIAEVTTRLQTMWPRLLELSAPPSYEGPRRDAYLKQQLSVRSATTGIDYSLRRRFNTPVVALLALSVLVLLISCVNVANLLLARGVARRREMALRVALGAGKWTLIQEELVENGLLLVVGVAAGVGIAYGADSLLLAAMSSMYTGLDLDLTPDTRTLAFTSVTSTAVFLTIAGIPTWKASRADPRTLLTGGLTRIVGDGGRIRGALVVSQVALALVLVSLAALFATSLARLRTAPIGFEPQGILSAQLVPMPNTVKVGNPDDPYYRELLQRLSVVPQVNAVALARFAPFRGRPLTGTVSTAGAADAAVQAELGVVSDSFFTTMGIPVIAGRSFRPTDASGSLIVAVVSESLGRKLSPGRDLLGTEIGIAMGDKKHLAQVVGVVRDAVLESPRDGNVLVSYLSLWQMAEMLRPPTLLLRTAGDPNQAAGFVRRELQQLGREYPTRIRTLRAERDASLSQEQLLASIAAAFAVLGLTLASVGLYGVLNFTVASRREELGLRMALGAERAHVVGLVVRRALTLMGVGVALGLPLAWAGARAARTLFPEVGSFDLVPLVVVIACLVGAGALASWLPARRAALVTPLEALRGS
jgi:predicted permease